MRKAIAGFGPVCCGYAQAYPAPKEDTVSLFAYCDPVDQSGSVYKDGIEYFRKGIARGIAEFLAHYRSLGFGIAGLRVAISRMVVHPVD